MRECHFLKQQQQQQKEEKEEEGEKMTLS